MSKRPRIAVVGSINMDLVVRCSQLPQPGETILGESMAEVPGGKGANQAVAAARLGAEVVLIGRVGDDAFGQSLRENLQRESVDTSFVLTTDRSCSGIAVVCVENSGENSIVVVPGANGHVGVDDVTHAASAIENSDILLVQWEVPIEAVDAAIQIARATGVPVVLDPAPALLKFPPGMFKVDAICPNQLEAAALLRSEVSSIDQAENAALELNRRGVRYAIITLGAFGAVLGEDGGVQRFEPYEITPIDSTAAGDAFAAALAVQMVEQDSIAEAVRFACAAGAVAASRLGAQPAMPTRDDVSELLGRRSS
ncbi:MAG: ribokinase [Planctomycetaceae bacterium]|nr:ribokinase [Planctomycetales bacterium]MCB9924292.1 ribokinase [Planctomycetaceae bacterium]